MFKSRDRDLMEGFHEIHSIIHFDEDKNTNIIANNVLRSSKRY